MKRILISALVPLVFACGGGVENTPPPPVQEMMPPEMMPDPMPSNDCSSQDASQTIQATGEVKGFWAGTVQLTGETTVVAGDTLEICPGTVIVPSADAKLIVQGELLISGTKEGMVSFGESPWTGIQIEGKISGGYFTMGAANVCIDGKVGSDIDLVAGMLLGCRQGFSVANGAHFDRMTILGGSSVYIRGGTLTMVDSVVDLRHPGASPDCVVWAGGGANLDHVRFTGCHCPIHMGRAELGITLTNSILDNGAVPIMIANASGTVTGNNIVGGSPQLLDIGGGIAVDFGGNYWGGGPSRASSGNLGQFANLSDYAATPFDGAGPR